MTNILLNLLIKNKKEREREREIKSYLFNCDWSTSSLDPSSLGRSSEQGAGWKPVVLAADDERLWASEYWLARRSGQ